MQTSVAPRPPLYASAERRLTDRYINWLSFVLLGYALLNRGFAYLGVAPIYIGEVTLLFGLLALARSGAAGQVLRSTTMRLVLALGVWGAIRSVPYLSTYGVTVLRDAVLWGYAAFAFIAAALLIEQPDRLKLFITRYRRFAVVFVSVIWIVDILFRVSPLLIPGMPGSPIGLLFFKAGDAQVHLGGIAAFALVGLVRLHPLTATLLVIELLVAGIYNRGGMVSAALAIAVVLALRPSAGSRVVRVGLVVAAVAALLVIIDPKVSVGEKDISVDQLVDNAVSVFVSSDSRRLEATKKWRLNWWGDIVDYTVFGPYLLTGKGFGINLANDDGYQVADHAPDVRSPHNGHLTILARAGLPGLVLWVLVHGAWFATLFRSFRYAKRRGDTAWTSVFIFLLAYGAAFMANASFDVFLEGPMGGVWFWTLFGVGIGAVLIYRHRPEVLWT